jgi:hypothetical protein
MHSCTCPSVTLSRYIKRRSGPNKAWIVKNGKYAYIQCVGPGEPYTDGETVIFKCYKIEEGP